MEVRKAVSQCEREGNREKMETRENNNNGRRTTMPASSHSHTHTESFHSPLRADSPLRSDDPPFSTPESSPAKSPCKAIIALDKYSRSHNPLEKRITSPEHRRPALVANATAAGVPGHAAAVRDDVSAVTKAGPNGGGEDGVGGENRSGRAVTSILRRSRREEMLRRAALGFRVCEMIFCLISFSVMAADRTQGWSGDSFDRYREYRYCLSVAVIGFVYSGFQAYDLAYHLVTGKHVIRHQLRCHFEFFMDQVLAYLLISASSAAATRVDDWQSNWGKDEFTEMASASVGMSFLAFLAFAFSSVISGYNLCSQDLS